MLRRFVTPVVSPKVWLALAVLIVVVDQFTKSLIVSAYSLGEGFAVTSFFNIVRVHNLGAAFSFLADAGGWQRWFFTGLGLAAGTLMVWLLFRHRGQTLFGLALALVLGGAIGNVIDRVVYAYVVDFLDSYWGSAHFPAFNIADSAITLGAGCLIWDEWRRSRREADAPSP